jgi:alpha-beta hydrolase superfamily lysophospholipase
LLLEQQPEDRIERSDPSCKEHNGVYPAAASYMQQVARVNVIAPWAKLDVPVLAIYGRSDIVTEAADHERIVAVVNAAHPSHATYTPIDGMDHFLSQAATAKDAVDAFSKNLPRKYDPECSRIIIAWLKAR